MLLKDFARTFGPGEPVACGRCDRPDRLTLSPDGITLRCERSIGRGKGRRRCKQRHFVIADGEYRVAVAIPRELYEAMANDGVTVERLTAAGVIEAAFVALSEVSDDRGDRARAA